MCHGLFWQSQRGSTTLVITVCQKKKKNPTAPVSLSVSCKFAEGYNCGKNCLVILGTFDFRRVEELSGAQIYLGSLPTPVAKLRKSMGQLWTLWIFFSPVLVSFKTQSCWRVLRLSPPHTHTHLQDLRHKLDPWCMKNACARPGQAGRQPESQAVHVSETRAMISMESHSRGSAAPAYCVSYTLRLLQRQHKPTVVTRPPSVAFPPGVWPTFINHSPGGPPTSFGRHNLWELWDSASPPPRSLVWLCNLAGRLSRTRRFSSLQPVNVIKLKRNARPVLRTQSHQPYCPLAPAMRALLAAPQDGGRSAVQQQVSQGQWQTRKVSTEVVQINSCVLVSPAWRPQLFLSPSVFIPSLPPQQKIKFAVDMSWWKEFKWYFE